MSLGSSGSSWLTVWKGTSGSSGPKVWKGLSGSSSLFGSSDPFGSSGPFWSSDLFGLSGPLDHWSCPDSLSCSSHRAILVIRLVQVIGSVRVDGQAVWITSPFRSSNPSGSSGPFDPSGLSSSFGSSDPSESSAPFVSSGLPKSLECEVE
ncbi:hypothetical protein DEO72_LG9g290 [Vigna unguiculata]|uniref:Uncharacterized protein n=2 Tax=Vigna unguiculata TaxID=3917 RepID=A0A4D6MZQ5_VIGUN|nr:hypothetical protein DEO72_LG9g290 [Vigna unguiculata]